MKRFHFFVMERDISFKRIGQNDTEIQQSINNGVISAIEAIDDNDEAKPLSAD